MRMTYDFGFVFVFDSITAFLVKFWMVDYLFGLFL
jgi:hypothetical protein